MAIAEGLGKVGFLMTFLGFDEKDGSALYDTKEAAITRAKQMKEWCGDPEVEIWIHRTWVPLWLCHLVRETSLQWIGYTRL